MGYINKQGRFVYWILVTFASMTMLFVLYAFQKKSKTGIKTPKENIDLINQRLAHARRIWQEMNQ